MNQNINNNIAIIVAAGAGNRVGGELPKQYQNINGVPMLVLTINQFLLIPQIKKTIIVISKFHRNHFDNLILPNISGNIEVAYGGQSRQDSVYEGLKLAANDDLVLIHDGARPFVKSDLIKTIIEETQKYRAAAPALNVTDTTWKVENFTVSDIIDRTNLYQAQTPQGFYKKDIAKFYRLAEKSETDDVSLALKNGLNVKIVNGDKSNIKITTPTDIIESNKLQTNKIEIRTGIGYDVHAFKKGKEIILCGLKIPYKFSLKGHSDSDVAMHALTDAIYGAIGEGDIGTWFPPEEKKWKNADSKIFLEHSHHLLKTQGFSISNIDCTIICEEPKIQPHTKNMKNNLSKILDIAVEKISIKATTSERLGSLGRKEGIATQAIATVIKN